MTFTKKLFAGAALLASALLLTPKAAHAVVAALVQVTNTTANPVPALDTERNARIPYQSQTKVICNGGNGACFFFFTPAPANFRLVVENVNGYFTMGAGAAPPVVFLNGATNTYGFTGINGSPFGFASLNQSLLAYFDPSDGAPSVAANGNFAGGVICSVVLDGHLENCAVTGCPAITR